jgi:hypothetical protein
MIFSIDAECIEMRGNARIPLNSALLTPHADPSYKIMLVNKCLASDTFACVHCFSLECCLDQVAAPGDLLVRKLSDALAVRVRAAGFPGTFFVRSFARLAHWFVFELSVEKARDQESCEEAEA